MSKILICLALALFVCAQAATQTQFPPIPPNPKNLTETVLEITLDAFIKEEQAAGRLPNEVLAVQRTNFQGRYLGYLTDKDNTTIKRTTDSYRYFLEFTLKSASLKTFFHVRLVPETDLQNTTFIRINNRIVANESFALWPGVSIVQVDDLDNYKINYDTSLFIKNATKADEIFARAREFPGYPGFYYKLLAQRPVKIELGWYQINYEFAVTLQNQLTGEVHEEIYHGYLDAQREKSKDPINPVYSYPVSGNIRPLVQSRNVKFANSTQLKFNPLVTLWDENLFRQLLLAGEPQIVEEFFKVFGKNATGRFFFDQTQISVTVTDTSLEYRLYTEIHAEPAYWYRPCHVIFSVKPTDESFTFSQRYVHPVWKLVNSFIDPEPPVWRD